MNLDNHKKCTGIMQKSPTRWTQLLVKERRNHTAAGNSKHSAMLSLDESPMTSGTSLDDMVEPLAPRTRQSAQRLDTERKSYAGFTRKQEVRETVRNELERLKKSCDSCRDL